MAEVPSGRQQRLKYVYDLGDYWVHEIAVEEVLATDTEEPVLLCVAGEGQYPPEDIGGAFGYEDFLEAIADPSHEAHVHYTDWIGGDFDSRHFDLEKINEGLAKLRRKWTRRRRSAAKRRSKLKR